MAFNYQLTEGAFQTIMNGGHISEPIIQVLGSKKINSTNKDKDRYRLLLSDGKYTISFGILTTQFNDKFAESATEIYSIIKLTRYITNVVNSVGKGDTRILLILDMKLIESGEIVGRPIGNPVPLTDGGASNSQNSDSSNTNLVLNKMMGDCANTSISHSQTISPISSLNPFHNNWIIKARVSNKTSIRSWSNSRGEGKLFSIDLIDESGEIRCTAFRDLVDKFFDLIEVDKVYYISKAQIKPANKQFCSIKHEFEMTLTNETIIEESNENNSTIPQLKYDFTSIEKVAAMEPGTVVDVMGVCKSASELQIFSSKSTNREMRKKEIVLVDQSKFAISLTLWGLQAETFDASNNPVIVIKGAKIGEFGGTKHLSTIMSSQFKVNPDIPESYRLKGWYELEGNQIDTKNVSERNNMGGMQAPWISFKDTQRLELGQSERGDYYQTMATVLTARTEKIFYKACPIPDCNKKVIDMENGMYRCEKCNREYSSFKYRLLVSMNIGDSSSSQWVTLFSSEAEKILGKTAQQIGEAAENDPDNAIKLFEEIDFKQFVFKCRAKMENYNDERRLKTVVVKVNPIDYEEYDTHLVEQIKKLISVNQEASFQL